MVIVPRRVFEDALFFLFIMVLPRDPYSVSCYCRASFFVDIQVFLRGPFSGSVLLEISGIPFITTKLLSATEGP